MGDAGDSREETAHRVSFDKWAARIMEMDDLTEAFEEAGRLVNAEIQHRGEAARLRADVAHRIREAGDLSIGQLAQRLGLSKGRTQRILNRAERDRP